MLRWFYIGLGCLIAASFVYSESVKRTGREPGELVSKLDAPDLRMPELPSLSLPHRGPPVLVFHVHDLAAVASVRAAVADDRIVAELPSGFALKEGRMVTTGPDATGAVLTAAGWTDRSLEIHQPAPRPPRFEQTARKGTAANRLANKSHLTQAEAMTVINQLD